MGYQLLIVAGNKFVQPQVYSDTRSRSGGEVHWYWLVPPDVPDDASGPLCSAFEPPAFRDRSPLGQLLWSVLLAPKIVKETRYAICCLLYLRQLAMVIWFEEVVQALWL
jgi:hypothetical protein